MAREGPCVGQLLWGLCWDPPDPNPSLGHLQGPMGGAQCQLHVPMDPSVPQQEGSPGFWEFLLLSLDTPGVSPALPRGWAQTPPAGMCPCVCPWGCWEGSLATAGSFSSSSARAARAAALWETPLFPSLNDALAEFFIFPPVTHRNCCAELPPPLGLPSHPAGDTQLLPGCAHSRLCPLQAVPSLSPGISPGASTACDVGWNFILPCGDNDC